MGTFTDILRDNKFTKEDLPAFEKKLFFEGGRMRPYRVRFSVLLFLSAIIATYGVIGNSDATVIGAMIIAPLMTPILAAAAALVMGETARAGRSLLLVGVGVLLVVGVSWAIGFRYTGYISFTDNSQIVSRVSPMMNDLIVALAAGAAGAFAMSRDDIADSMPGVAISISLVPPLCVAGLALASGQWSDASGAMLLFLTNLLSILLAGGAVFAVLSLGVAATQDLRGHARRNAFIFIAVGVLLVSVPLAATSAATATSALVQYRTAQAARDWVDGTEYEVRTVKATPGGATVLIAGSGLVPDTDELAADLQSKLGRELAIHLEIVPFEKKLVTVKAPSG